MIAQYKCLPFYSTINLNQVTLYSLNEHSWPQKKIWTVEFQLHLLFSQVRVIFLSLEVACVCCIWYFSKKIATAGKRWAGVQHM